MFRSSDEKLEEKGAIITTREIQQQPALWKEAFENYKNKKDEINKFLQDMIDNSNEKKIKVIFTGAGTSQYVGDTITPYLNKAGNTTKYSFESIATTDIVASPLDYLNESEPTILVSFARSGNSPESVATVNITEKIVKNLNQITITCAEDGELSKKAKTESNNLLLLQPSRSNDKGFAMTGSFSCMALTAMLVFDQSTDAQKELWINNIIEMGKEVIYRETEIQEITNLDFDRIAYIGSGALSGLTREAQLKVLELTAGQLTTIFDSSMGLRHGPKSYLNEKTVVFSFLNSDQYTRFYDVDILKEIKEDNIVKKVIGIGQSTENNFSGDNFFFKESNNNIPEGYLALPDIMFGQTFALQCSLKVGNKPDTPSKTGTVNRVVKGVIIHEL